MFFGEVMSKKVCPNCFFKNEDDNEFCQECESSLDLDDYIESKKFNKTFFNKLKSIVYRVLDRAKF